MESIYLNIELYKEDHFHCAYISEDGSSCYKIRSHTAEQCAEKIKKYIIDTFYRD